MLDAGTTQVFASLADGDLGGADAGAPEFSLALSLAALDGAPLGNAAVEVAAMEVVRRLGDLRATLARYVRARRAAEVPVAQVLAEVRDLVRLGAAQESWSDPDNALTWHALRCALGVYHDHGRPATAPCPVRVLTSAAGGPGADVR